MFKTIQFAVLIQLPFSMTLLCMDHTRTLPQRVLTEPYVWNILTQKDSYFTHATPVIETASPTDDTTYPFFNLLVYTLFIYATFALEEEAPQHKLRKIISEPLIQKVTC